jgi:hypothetical protein
MSDKEITRRQLLVGALVGAAYATGADALHGDERVCQGYPGRTWHEGQADADSR